MVDIKKLIGPLAGLAAASALAYFGGTLHGKANKDKMFASEVLQKAINKYVRVELGDLKEDEQELLREAKAWCDQAARLYVNADPTSLHGSYSLDLSEADKALAAAYEKFDLLPDSQSYIDDARDYVLAQVS